MFQVNLKSLIVMAISLAVVSVGCANSGNNKKVARRSNQTARNTKTVQYDRCKQNPKAMPNCAEIIKSGPGVDLNTKVPPGTGEAEAKYDKTLEELVSSNFIAAKELASGTYSLAKVITEVSITKHTGNVYFGLMKVYDGENFAAGSAIAKGTSTFTGDTDVEVMVGYAQAFELTNNSGALSITNEKLSAISMKANLANPASISETDAKIQAAAISNIDFLKLSNIDQSPLKSDELNQKMGGKLTTAQIYQNSANQIVIKVSVQLESDTSTANFVDKSRNLYVIYNVVKKEAAADTSGGTGAVATAASDASEKAAAVQPAVVEGDASADPLEGATLEMGGAVIN